MRNFIFLVLFLLLIGGLIFWLWSDRGDEKTLEQAITEQQEVTIPSTGLPKINLDEVEIAYDETGLILQKLFNKEVNLTLSQKPVRNVEVYDGIMTYQEQSDGNWNFRSYNLGQYIETNMKDE